MSIPPSASLLTSALLTLAGLALPAVAEVEASTPSPEAIFTEIPGRMELSGRMIVRPLQFKAWTDAGVSAAAAGGLVGAAHQLARKAAVLEYVPQTDEYIISVAEGQTESSTSLAFMDTGLFQYAEPDWIVYPLGVPNDPGFSGQWHHGTNRMQSANGWDIHTGDPAVAAVAICDTGVRTTHEDLLLHRLEGYNAVNHLWESQGGQIGPVSSHGTLCTGSAAANGNNNKGVAGVGWNLSHRMMRVSNDSSGGAYLSDIQHGARKAIETGDRVASVSYSGVDNGSNLTTASYIKSQDGLLVWAAGNDSRNLTYGNRDADDLIVVGATDTGDSRASFSAYGRFVDLTAPGVNIYTTDSGHNSDYAAVSGTSFATPLTAGLVALIWSYNPSLTPDEVEDVLKAGCDDLGSNGVDDIYGYGRIDVYNALSSISPSCPAPVNYCSTSPNSVGPGATMTWSGTTSLTAGDFELVAVGCPPSQFGIFYYGGDQISVPFGDGIRCVGSGGLGTYRFPPFQTDVFGGAFMQVDFSVPPVSSGPGAWFVGDEWQVQFWYRDPSGGPADFNLSDGLQIEICP